MFFQFGRVRLIHQAGSLFSVPFLYHTESLIIAAASSLEKAKVDLKSDTATLVAQRTHRATSHNARHSFRTVPRPHSAVASSGYT